MEKQNILQVIAIVLLTIMLPYLVMGIFMQLGASENVVLGVGLFSAISLAILTLFKMSIE